MGWFGQRYRFRGRTNRLNYLGTGVLIGVQLGFAVKLALFTTGALTHHRLVLGLLLLGVTLAELVLIVWMHLATMARRIRDMGQPVWRTMGAYSVLLFVGITAPIAAEAALRLGHPQPVLVHMGRIANLLMGALGLMLLFWPSKPVEPDNAQLDGIFGEAGPVASDQPQLVKPPSRIPLFDPRKPQRPPPLAAPVVRDASGGIAPRAQFGLRRQ
jgi:uncharacterized membrane protein YhaH (DUF805 family)